MPRQNFGLRCPYSVSGNLFSRHMLSESVPTQQDEHSAAEADSTLSKVGGSVSDAERLSDQPGARLSVSHRVSVFGRVHDASFCCI